MAVEGAASGPLCLQERQNRLGDGVEDLGVPCCASLDRKIGLNVDERYARGSGANRHYFLTDALGSSIALTDGQGAVRQRYHYTPYGQTSSSGVEDYANPYQYTGRERDASGLYFYRARYYSPQMARFLSEDPSGFAGGLNLYGYVHQDPLSLVDPDGNVPIAPLVWGGAKMYARCTAACSAQSAIIDRLTGGCTPLSDIGKDCAVLCLNPLNWGGGGNVARANPYGRHGGPRHRETVKRRAEELTAQGYIITGGGGGRERAVRTPEGRVRYPDISAKTPSGRPYYENIGRSTRDGRPVARERRAIDDINRATGTRTGYTPYDR